MPPTVRMVDLARAAGVSSMTVSRAFRQDSSVDERTRRRILEIAEEMGYVFDTTAANLRRQKTGFVAVTVPSINNANFAETVYALSAELSAAGLQVLLGYDLYDTAVEERLIEQLVRRRPEAIVVTGGSHTERTRKRLAASGVPVVETWDLPAQPIGNVVGFSNARAMELMVDHLVAQGLTRIAFLGGETSEDTRGADRRRGFREAMRRHGLDDSHLVPVGAPHATMATGAQAMAALLDSEPGMEAAIGVSDLAAFGALSACQTRGMRVPDDIAIAGFGAYDVGAVCVPPLTTIDPHCAEIGRRTGKLLVDLLSESEPRRARVSIEIDPAMLARGSTSRKDRPTEN